MPKYTPEEAERIGREAVALGMPCCRGITWRMESWGSRGIATNDDPAWYSTFPDINDPLTAKAFELWAEGVARAKYGAAFHSVEVHSVSDRSTGELRECAVITLWVCDDDFGNDRGFVELDAPTMPEACIALVRAMKEAT